MGILDAAWLYFLLDFLFPTCLFLYCLCPLPLFLPVSALVLLLLFLSKTIKVKIIDDEEYEKNKAFYIEIGEPHLVESNNKGQKAAGRHDAVTELTLGLHVYKESTWRTFSCLSTIPPDVSGSRLWSISSHHNHHSRSCVCVRVGVCDFIPCPVACWPCMYSSPLCVYVCVWYRKTITIRILDREEYNKQSSFYLLLDSPQWRRSRKEQTGVRTSRHPESQINGPTKRSFNFVM